MRDDRKNFHLWYNQSSVNPITCTAAGNIVYIRQEPKDWAKNKTKLSEIFCLFLTKDTKEITIHDTNEAIMRKHTN